MWNINFNYNYFVNDRHLINLLTFHDYAAWVVYYSDSSSSLSSSSLSSLPSSWLAVPSLFAYFCNFFFNFSLSRFFWFFFFFLASSSWESTLDLSGALLADLLSVIEESFLSGEVLIRLLVFAEAFTSNTDELLWEGSSFDGGRAYSFGSSLITSGITLDSSSWT